MSEAEAAASYWSARRLGAFSHERPWSSVLADRIADFHPGAVFEFGCNVGRHMRAIAERLPGTSVSGVDIHLPAVQEARRKGLDVMLGDEYTLPLIPRRFFDVAYTVSVIDHLPDPRLALQELDRIATVLVLVEPWIGHEAKLEDTGTSPWTYSWDYGSRIPWRAWAVHDFPLHGAGAGPYYRMHVGT